MNTKNLKPGDKVQIKSKRWFNKNKDKFDMVDIEPVFTKGMSEYCGKIVTVRHLHKSGSIFIDELTLEEKDSECRYYFGKDCIYKQIKE